MTVPADKARAVRAMHVTGRWSHRRLAAKFNLSRVTIWRILTGLSCHGAGAAEPVVADENPDFSASEAQMHERLAAFFDRYADPQCDLWRDGRAKAGPVVIGGVKRPAASGPRQ